MRKWIFISLLLVVLWPARAQTTTYFYVVRTIDSLGIESASSTEIAVPVASIVAAAQHTATLSWTAAVVKTNPIAGYNIYRSTTTGTGYVKIGNVPASTLTFSDVTVPPSPPLGLSVAVQ